MVDTHFMTGFLRVGLAADPDLLLGSASFSPASAPRSSLRWPPRGPMPWAMCRRRRCRSATWTTSSAAHRHTARSSSFPTRTPCRRRSASQIPLLRAGFPQYDWVGGYARTWVGYRGARQALFDIANLFLGNPHDIPVHRSIYRTDSWRDAQGGAPAGAGLVRHQGAAGHA
jgi:nitrogenase molybdenum-iron protein NifN